MNENSTEIKGKINELEQQLEFLGTRQTEVYARIVGYYRSVKNWNKGKKEEYQIRKPFVYNGDNGSRLETQNNYINNATVSEESLIDEQPELMLHDAKKNSSQKELLYLFFQRKTCPNCPPMKAAISESNIEGTVIDVDTEDGLGLAKEYSVFSAPTVVFLDNEKRELFRTDSPELFTSFVEKKETVEV